MVRVLASAALVLALCAGTAWAKPKIAVLGLEAVPGGNGVVDPATTQIARAITKELRQRAQSAASPYVIAPNSSKELTDEKLLMSCDSEAAPCMAVIGAGLAADVLLYGRVEKRGETYRISLKRLDVKARTVAAGGEEVAIGSAVAPMAKRLYVKLVGEAAVVGTLTVRATSASGAVIGAGTVLIDDEPRGKLASGRIVVSELPEGRHVLAIEAGGYRRFEETVTIHAGDQATLNALLLIGDAPAGSHGALWKWTLGTSLAVAAIGGGLALAGFLEQQHYNDQINPMPAPNTPDLMRKVTSADCGQSAESLKSSRMLVFDESKFNAACRWHDLNVAGFVVLGIGGAGALFSLIMVIRDASDDEAPPPAKKLALRPEIAPGYSGASLSVRW
jgi:hypothetical protein